MMQFHAAVADWPKSGPALAFQSTRAAKLARRVRTEPTRTQAAFLQFGRHGNHRIMRLPQCSGIGSPSLQVTVASQDDERHL